MARRKVGFFFDIYTNAIDILRKNAHNGKMKNHEFRRIRFSLGFTQAELSEFLGYASAMRISEMERETNPRPIPDLLARLMKAYESGYRPKHWPK